MSVLINISKNKGKLSEDKTLILYKSYSFDILRLQFSFEMYFSEETFWAIIK